MMNHFKVLFKLSILLAIAVMMVQFYVPVTAAPQKEIQRMPSSDKIPDELEAVLDGLQSDQKISVIITLQDQADLSQIPGSTRASRLTGIIRALQAMAESSQASVRMFLSQKQEAGQVSHMTPLWIMNGLSVTANSAVIQELAARPDVRSITPDEIDVVPVGMEAYLTPQMNLTRIRVPQVWDSGWFGQGVVIASMDTGVDFTHPELSSSWRGGNNSWFDPYGQHGSPVDLNGHGTQTMGVMVGSDATGSSIGVAPQSQWIAVKIFNDAGSATATAIHLGYQWLLDPDNNPTTNDAPDAVNNSWTFGAPGCNLEFQLDLQALQAAGILPVFAAGNFGPGSGTSASPANNPAAFAVGAVDNSDQIYIMSSRGPSSCGESVTMYPEMAAPGVDIFTSDTGGFYTTVSGTSLAAPHVTGSIALLLSAFPNLSVEQQAAALLNGAVDASSPGPDNDTGYGRLDALVSYQWLLNGGANPTLTPTPLPTATPTPTPSLPGMHIGDLDSSITLVRKGWSASVNVKVHDINERPVSGVKVTGLWSGGFNSVGSCTTDKKGMCKISSGTLNNTITSVSFGISDLMRSGYVYYSWANHDPDGDSTGTYLVITNP